MRGMFPVWSPAFAMAIRQSLNIALFIFLHRIQPEQSSQLNTL